MVRLSAFCLLFVGCTKIAPSERLDAPTPNDPTPLTSETSGGPAGGGPTWYQDVAPLVADRCGACHRSGGVAPFSIETYDEAAAWGPAMVAAIADGSMPPFFASDDEVCEERLGLLDDVRLSDSEKDLISDWVDAGMPAGDPTEAAAAPLRPIDDLVDYDLQVGLQEPFTVDGDEDIYECFRIPLGLDEDVWLTGLQVLADAELVVHHVLVWSDPTDASEGRAGPDDHYGCSGFPDVFPSELIAAWSPGGQPTRSPPGTGTPLQPGGSLVVNIHYHPTGTTREIDQTQLRLQWTTDAPAEHTTWYLVDVPFGAVVQPGEADLGGTEFRIPAGATDHQETEELWLPPVLFSDLTIFAVAPHMHYLGIDQLVTLDHEDEPDECLVHTPGYRFDFQQGYAFDPSTGDLPVFHPGDRLRVQCRYNNSTSNPFLPLHLDASGSTEPHDVYWGEETGEEMCMVMVGFIVPADQGSVFDWF